MNNTDTIFDDEMMAVLEDRSDDYLAGRSKTFTLEESIKNIYDFRKALENNNKGYSQ